MLNEGEGSNVARGRKKRRKLRPNTPEKPATAAHTMRRRNLLTGGSGSLATTGPAAGGLVARFAPPLVHPGLTARAVAGVARAAAGVAAGTSLPGTSPGGVASETVPDDASRAEGGTTVEGVEGVFDA